MVWTNIKYSAKNLIHSTSLCVVILIGMQAENTRTFFAVLKKKKTLDETVPIN